MRYLARFELGCFLIMIGLLVFLFFRSCDRHKDKVNSSSVLSPDTAQKIVVNPAKHSLEVITPDKDTTLFLPDRPSSIEVNKTGEVKLSSPQFGTEFKFFFGIQASNAFRFGAGIDSLYYKRMDFGLGIANQVGMHTPVVFGKISYLIYDNLQVGVTYDSLSHGGLSLTVRI